MLRAAATERNREAIADVLKFYLKDGFRVLEIASGTGQHVAHFAPQFPAVQFQPSDCDPRNIHSIVGYVDHFMYPNMRVPLYIDVSKPVSSWTLPADFASRNIDVMFNANMIHISSNAAVEGLFQAAGLLLPSGGMLITYGPYADGGRLTPQSNRDFDAGLRTQNEQWGIRDATELEKMARDSGMVLQHVHDMPANNKILVFYRQ